MKCFFTQAYIDPDAGFPLSYHFQELLSAEVGNAVVDTREFYKDFGSGFDLTFYISAKAGISSPEIVGPGVFKKSKDVEFTIFLPFPTGYSGDREGLVPVIGNLFSAIEGVLDRLKIPHEGLALSEMKVVKAVLHDSEMTK